MEYKSINFNKVSSVEILTSFKKGEFIPPTNKEKKEILSKFEKELSRGKYIQARNYILIGILFDAENAFLFIKKRGCFRYSNYINKKCVIGDLAKELYDIIKKEQIAISQPNITYLDSIINFSSVIDSYNKLDKFIHSEIKYFLKTYPDKSIIKSFLSFLDFVFLKDHQRTDKLEINSLTSRSKEEISEAVSSLIYRLSEKYDFEKISISKISEEYIQTNRIESPISAACLISDLKEFEILIDYFEYACIKGGDVIRIVPPFADFEKSIRLSYIRNQIQQANDVVNYEKAASFEELVEAFTGKDLNLFEYTETANYPRYILKIPEPLFEYLNEKIFKDDRLFREEVNYLSSVFKEQLLNFDDLLKTQVRENLNLLEFLKIKRVFSFYQILFSKKIFELEKVRHDVLFRSLVPIFENESIYTFFNGIVSNEKLDDFLDIIYWEQGSGKFLDLQYHSLLFMKNTYLAPLTVFVNSNAIRNLFASEYKQNNEQLLKDGKTDPLVINLSKILNEAKIENYTNIPIAGGEIDLLAIIENKIIVFECKHSLNPTTVYELRTTYDYIKKATSQLQKINEKFASGELLKTLKSVVKTDITKIDKIYSCIVLSNRMFNGNIFKYPVRNINELENFFIRGTFRTKEGEFWFWDTDKLAVLDIEKYLTNNNPVLEHMQNNLNKYTLKYEFNSPTIEYDTYNLLIDEAEDSLAFLSKNFRKVEA